MNRTRRLLIPIFLAALVAAITPLTALAATQPRLGTASSFSILAGAGITNTGPSSAAGDVGTFPTPTETGFVTLTIGGTNHAGDAVTQGAKNALVTAYNDTAGQTPTRVLTGVDLGTLAPLVPGVYFFSSSAQLTGTLTLSGFGVYIFQIGSALTTASASTVLMTNNAQACGVYWQIGSSATFGTRSHMEGTVMALTSITMTTSATLNGRALARNGAVTLDTNTITMPAANCAGLPNTGIPSELIGGQFPLMLLIALGTGGAVVALVVSRERRRRRLV